MEVDSYVITNGTARIYHRTAGRRVRTLGAFRAWPAGACYIGAEVAHLGPSAALIERLAGGLLLTTALYLALFWLLGERLSQPWLRTVIFWLPAVFILLPEGWGLGVLLYSSTACLVTALVSYGGCEVVALPSLLFRRYYTVYCPLNAIDLIERRYTRTGNGAQNQG